MSKFKTRRVNNLFLRKLENIVGDRNAGLLVACLGDLINELTCNDVCFLRTLEVTLNNFFSIKYDFEKDEVVQNE